jgi:hypothetical protein
MDRFRCLAKFPARFGQNTSRLSHLCPEEACAYAIIGRIGVSGYTFVRYLQSNESGLLEKTLTLAGGAVLLVVGLMFSAVMFVVILVLGLLAWGYFWWKTRELRKVMRECSPSGGVVSEGEVIEGEAIIVDDVKEEGRNAS